MFWRESLHSPHLRPVRRLVVALVLVRHLRAAVTLARIASLPLHDLVAVGADEPTVGLFVRTIQGREVDIICLIVGAGVRRSGGKGRTGLFIVVAIPR